MNINKKKLLSSVERRRQEFFGDCDIIVKRKSLFFPTHNPFRMEVAQPDKEADD